VFSAYRERASSQKQTPLLDELQPRAHETHHSDVEMAYRGLILPRGRRHWPAYFAREPTLLTAS
jgi:hypothetical protein